MEHVATLELVPELRAPHAARAFAGATLAEWNLAAEAVEAAQLVISELVTNALRHASDSPDVTLQLVLTDDCIRVLVSDGGPGEPKQARPDAGSSDVSGRGLWIVDAFTNHWGTEPNARGGKTVWCEIPTEPVSKR